MKADHSHGLIWILLFLAWSVALNAHAELKVATKATADRLNRIEDAGARHAR